MELVARTANVSVVVIAHLIIVEIILIADFRCVLSLEDLEERRSCAEAVPGVEQKVRLVVVLHSVVMRVVRDTHLVLHLAKVVLIVCKAVFNYAEDVLPASIVLECEVCKVILLHIVGTGVDDHIAAAYTVVIEAALVLLRSGNVLEDVVRSATIALSVEIQP